MENEVNTVRVRVLPATGRPSGHAWHVYSVRPEPLVYDDHGPDEIDPDYSHFHGLSDMSRIMTETKCDLMNCAGDLLAAQHYLPARITTGQVEAIVRILARRLVMLHGNKQNRGS